MPAPIILFPAVVTLMEWLIVVAAIAFLIWWIWHVDQARKRRESSPAPAGGGSPPGPLISPGSENSDPSVSAVGILEDLKGAILEGKLDDEQCRGLREIRRNLEALDAPGKAEALHNLDQLISRLCRGKG